LSAAIAAEAAISTTVEMSAINFVTFLKDITKPLPDISRYIKNRTNAITKNKNPRG